MKISNVEDFEIGFKIGLYLEEYSYAEIIEDEDAMQRVVNRINNVLSSFTHVQVDCQNSDAIYNKAVESYCDKMLKTDKNAVMYLYIGKIVDLVIDN